MCCWDLRDVVVLIMIHLQSPCNWDFSCVVVLFIVLFLSSPLFTKAHPILKTVTVSYKKKSGLKSFTHSPRKLIQCPRPLGHRMFFKLSSIIANDSNEHTSDNASLQFIAVSSALELSARQNLHFLNKCIYHILLYSQLCMNISNHNKFFECFVTRVLI